MATKRKLSKGPMRELVEHRNDTCRDLIKVYSRAQLSFMDKCSEDTVDHNGRYLPVRVDSGPAMDRYRRGTQRKPYRIMYIRLDEIKYIFKKRNRGKELVVDYVKDR